MASTIHELEAALNSTYGQLATTSEELEGKLEGRCQISLRQETALPEISENIEEHVDDENLEEELEGVDQYEVFISYMKTHKLCILSRVHIIVIVYTELILSPLQRGKWNVLGISLAVSS